VNNFHIFDQSAHHNIGSGLLCSKFTYYAFEQYSKIKPIMLNIMLSNLWSCIVKCCLITVFCHISTDCSIIVSDFSIRIYSYLHYLSRSGCCKACLILNNPCNYIGGLIDEKGSVTKRLWSYIKSQRKDHCGVAPLKVEGIQFTITA